MTAVPVILDTAFLFAFLIAEDEDHQEACDVMLDVARGARGTPIVLDLVVSELFTLLRARRSGRVAEQTAAVLLFDQEVGIPRVRIWSIDRGRLPAVAERLRHHEVERLSFVDAAQLVLCQDVQGAEIVTFDGPLRWLADGHANTKK